MLHSLRSILAIFLMTLVMPATHAEAGKRLLPGTVYRDCRLCPEMVVVPAGSFMMGMHSSETGGKPVHKVTIAKPFAVGKFEVTFAEWDACVSDDGCKHRPKDIGWGRGNRPVINVSWNDITQQYLPWLSRKTGKTYRLLSEAEWEYVARAGTATPYWWGLKVGKGNANCDGCGSQWDDEQTATVGSFKANAFGLYDIHGNVWEWTADCWNSTYKGAPNDGSSWTSGNCKYRVLRGGSWKFDPEAMRAAARDRYQLGNRYFDSGFRVVRVH